MEKGNKTRVKTFFKEIKGHNWVNPLILFLVLHHFVDVAYRARYHFEEHFTWSETVEVSSESYFMVSIVASLIVGVVLGVLHIWLGYKKERIKEYWQGNYWKDIACFCIIFVVAQIVSVAMLEISFINLNSSFNMFLEKAFYVVRFIFPQAIHIPCVLPGVIVYYLLLSSFSKKGSVLSDDEAIIANCLAGKEV